MKSCFEARGGTYAQVGGVQFPNWVMDPRPEGKIGVWGWRRKRYLKEHKKGVYNAMLLDGTLTQHLIDTNAEAMDIFDSHVRQLAKAEGVTEELKRQDPVGIGAVIAPYIASVATGMLEVGQPLIGELMAE